MTRFFFFLILFFTCFLKEAAFAYDCGNYRMTREDKMRFAPLNAKVKFTSLYFEKSKTLGENLFANAIIIEDGRGFKKNQKIKIELTGYPLYGLDYNHYKALIGKQQSLSFIKAPLELGICTHEYILDKNDPYFVRRKELEANSKNNIDASLALAHFYLYWNDRAEFEKIIKDIEAKNPKNEKFIHLKAHSFFENGKYKEAEIQINKLTPSPYLKIFAALNTGLKKTDRSKKSKQKHLNENLLDDFSYADFSYLNIDTIMKQEFNLKRKIGSFFGSPYLNLSQLNAPYSQWNNIYIEYFDFNSANLENASFKNSTLHGIEFHNTNFKNVNFSNSKIYSMSFTENVFENTSFQNVHFKNMGFYKSDLSKANLSGVKFENVKIDCATKLPENFDISQHSIIPENSCNGKYVLDFTNYKLPNDVWNVNWSNEKIINPPIFYQSKLIGAEIYLGDKKFSANNNKNDFTRATFKNVKNGLPVSIRSNYVTYIGQEKNNGDYSFKVILDKYSHLSVGNTLKNLNLEIELGQQLRGNDKMNPLPINHDFEHKALENIETNRFENVNLKCSDTSNYNNQKLNESNHFYLTDLDKNLFKAEWSFLKTSAQKISALIQNAKNISVDENCVRLLAKIEG